MKETKSESLSKGSYFILAAATGWGIAGGVGGMLIAGGWSPLVVSLFRGILTFAFAAIWFAVSAKKGELASAHLWFWSTFAGLGVTGAFSFYFMGMDGGSVAIAATLLYSAPVFVYLAAFLSGSEKISIPKALGLLPVVAGVALLTEIYSQAKIGVRVTTVAIGLLSGVSYAAFIFGFSNASAHGSPNPLSQLRSLLNAFCF